MLYIVTGGSGSGKSEYAEQIAVQCRNGNGGTLWYLATMRIWDDEGRKRVERHRRMRAAKGFETIERYLRDCGNLSGVKAATISVNGNDQDVKVEFAPDRYDSIAKLQGMMITTATGNTLPLESQKRRKPKIIRNAAT